MPAHRIMTPTPIILRIIPIMFNANSNPASPTTPINYHHHLEMHPALLRKSLPPPLVFWSYTDSTTPVADKEDPTQKYESGALLWFTSRDQPCFTAYGRDQSAVMSQYNLHSEIANERVSFECFEFRPLYHFSANYGLSPMCISTWKLSRLQCDH